MYSFLCRFSSQDSLFLKWGYKARLYHRLKADRISIQFLAYASDSFLFPSFGSLPHLGIYTAKMPKANGRNSEFISKFE